MKRFIIGAALLTFTSVAGATGLPNCGWPYACKPVVVTKTVTNTVTKTEQTEKSSGGDGGAGIAAMALVAANFVAAVCQKEEQRPANGPWIPVAPEHGGGGFYDQKNPVISEFCRKGDLPDPFESFVQ